MKALQPRNMLWNSLIDISLAAAFWLFFSAHSTAFNLTSLNSGGRFELNVVDLNYSSFKAPRKTCGGTAHPIMKLVEAHASCPHGYTIGTFTLDAHSIRIGICIVQIQIECAFITFILHFKLSWISTSPHDLQGMKMAPSDAIFVLALVFCLNYVWLCSKHAISHVQVFFTR